MASFLSSIPSMEAASIAPPASFTRFHLPGLNLPLNWVPHPEWREYTHVGGEMRQILHLPFGATVIPLFESANKPVKEGDGEALFPSALNDVDVGDDRPSALRLIALRELTMMQIMDSITDKPGWETKVNDQEIADKWTAEMLAAADTDVTENMAKAIIAELRYKAKKFNKTGKIIVYDSAVVKSDTIVPESTKLALQAAVRKLEDIPAAYKDYHPGSNGQVLDLVHPSLFPLIYGRSRVLPDSLVGLDDCVESCGKGNIIQIREDDETVAQMTRRVSGGWRNRGTTVYSKNYQWLPSEVEFTEDGKPKFASYINNLHPASSKELYGIIEDVLDHAIPLWNSSLTPLIDSNTYTQRVRVPYDTVKYSPDPDDIPEDQRPQQGPNENEDDFWDRVNDWENSIKVLVLPDAVDFQAPAVPENVVALKRDYGFGEGSLQVIVKLANIELTPENPTYNGGAWHVEGQLNEHICATALYYYDSENITASRLAFRQQSSNRACDDYNYPQSDHLFLEQVYGIFNNVAVQTLGSVACTEGRLLTFPNLLQHQVQPFTLADPTKPGHRKILALFLVDPHIRVISTANVPPQQRDWWSEAVERDSVSVGKGLGGLSAELRKEVFNNVDDFPISMEEAKEIRLKLMEERSKFVIPQGRQFEATEFSLCEH